MQLTMFPRSQINAAIEVITAARMAYFNYANSEG